METTCRVCDHCCKLQGKKFECAITETPVEDRDKAACELFMPKMRGASGHLSKQAVDLSQARKWIAEVKSELKLLKDTRTALISEKRKLDGVGKKKGKKTQTRIEAEGRWRAHFAEWSVANRKYSEKKRRIVDRLSSTLRDAAMRIRGREDVEKVVWSSVVFWDWYGDGAVEEPSWLHEMRNVGRDDLESCDDVEVGAGLVLAGYSPAEASKRLITNHINVKKQNEDGQFVKVQLTDEEKKAAELQFTAEITKRVHAIGVRRLETA